MIDSGELRKGISIELDGGLYQVIDYQHIKIGRGSAMVRLKLRDIRAGHTTERTFQASEKFTRARLDYRTMQYLYNDDDLYYFMDEENYEQMPISANQLGNALNYLKEGMSAEVSSYKGELVGVELPITVELQVIEAEPGFKAIVIGEFLEHMFVPELRKRVGESGEIAIFDMNPKHRITMEKLWKYGPDTYIPERHQWDYPYADDYPDEYFDLVWLPQGVHHARSWKEIAPRLVRVLKPHGQIMMMENRTGNVEFFNALNMSGLLRCIAEKIWWGWNMTLEELPDYPTVVLEEAFDGLLYDTYSLEWKGWLLFWGYKK